MNSRLCRFLNDGIFEVHPKFVELERETSKIMLVAALKETFADCERAFAKLDEKTAAETFVTASGRRVPKGSALTIVTPHSNEEYGTLAMMLRLKGLVPPSSEPPRPTTPRQ